MPSQTAALAALAIQNATGQGSGAITLATLTSTGKNYPLQVLIDGTTTPITATGDPLVLDRLGTDWDPNYAGSTLVPAGQTALSVNPFVGIRVYGTKIGLRFFVLGVLDAHDLAHEYALYQSSTSASFPSGGGTVMGGWGTAAGQPVNGACWVSPGADGSAGGTITFTRGGIYHIFTRLLWATFSAASVTQNGRMGTMLPITGARAENVYNIPTPLVNGQAIQNIQTAFAYEREFAAGDTLAVQPWQNSGSTQALSGTHTWEIRRVGPTPS